MTTRNTGKPTTPKETEFRGANVILGAKAVWRVKPAQQTHARQRMPPLTLEPTKLAYLMTPYTHKLEEVMQDRFQQAVDAARVLTRKYMVYSPIVQNHMLAIADNLPRDAEYWWRRNKLMIDKVDVAIGVIFDGFYESHGVAKELDYCRTIKRQIIYYQPYELGLDR